MKPQDILFLLVLAMLFYTHNPKHFTIFGLASIILAMPLFALHVFFTAERLVMYSAGFFLVTVSMYIWQSHKQST